MPPFARPKLAEMAARPRARAPHQNGLLYRFGLFFTTRRQVSFHSRFDICVERLQVARQRAIGVVVAARSMPRWEGVPVLSRVGSARAKPTSGKPARTTIKTLGVRPRMRFELGSDMRASCLLRAYGPLHARAGMAQA